MQHSRSTLSSICLGISTLCLVLRTAGRGIAHAGPLLCCAAFENYLGGCVTTASLGLGHITPPVGVVVNIYLDLASREVLAISPLSYGGQSGSMPDGSTMPSRLQSQSCGCKYV